MAIVLPLSLEASSGGPGGENCGLTECCSINFSIWATTSEVEVAAADPGEAAGAACAPALPKAKTAIPNATLAATWVTAFLFTSNFTMPLLIEREAWILERLYLTITVENLVQILWQRLQPGPTLHPRIH